MSQEHWRPIAGYEDLYQISDQGRVWSSRRGRMLKSSVIDRAGHHGVALYKQGHGRRWRVHRLVLENFVGPCPEGLMCRHLNGDGGDNQISNLVWGTASENMWDRVRHGTHHHVRRDHCSKGHPKDGVVLRPDGTVRQRVCKTCLAEYQRKRRLKRTTCKKGHPLDGVRHRADGSIYQRYCTTCVEDQMQGGRGLMGKRTHCKYGHALDGQYARQRYCKTCRRDRQARNRGTPAA